MYEREKLLADVAKAIGDALVELGDYSKDPPSRARAFLNEIQPLVTGLIVEVIRDRNALVGALVGGVINPLWDMLEPEAVEYIITVIAPASSESKGAGG